MGKNRRGVRKKGGFCLIYSNILFPAFVALQVFYVFRLYCDADRKYEILKRNVTEPIFDFFLEGNDGLIICPPGILLRDWSPLNYVEYSGRDKDPRKSIFGKEALHAVLIIVPFSTDNWKGFDTHDRTLHLYGGDHDSKPVSEKFHGSIAKSTHKTKLENELSNNKVDVVCLSRAREMSSIYPGDPILQMNANGKPVHVGGIPKVIEVYKIVLLKYNMRYSENQVYLLLYLFLRWFELRSTLLMRISRGLL